MLIFCEIKRTLLYLDTALIMSVFWYGVIKISNINNEVGNIRSQENVGSLFEQKAGNKWQNDKPPKHCHGKKWSITKKKAKTIGKRLKIITGNKASWCSYLSKPSLWQSNSDDWMKVCVHSNTHIIAKTFKACNKIMYYKILFISLLLQPFCMYFLLCHIKDK